ncbi:MAG: hypothetical protein IPL96_03715 [Holophagaceae bacterium]|nr:hypothetical protein [Holophagaceae bacterium]
MKPLELIMPAILLLLSFLLKLLIDRTAKIPDAISSALELPVDITFLAVSLVVGYTISPSGDAKFGLACFGFYILVAIIIVFIWRRSVFYFTIDMRKTTIFLGIFNYFLSTTAIVVSIKLVTGGLNVSK